MKHLRFGVGCGIIALVQILQRCKFRGSRETAAVFAGIWRDDGGAKTRNINQI